MAFDLDAALAEGEPADEFEFVFGGETFALPADIDLARLSNSSNTALLLDALERSGQLAKLEEMDAVFGIRASTRVIDEWRAHIFGEVGKAREAASAD